MVLSELIIITSLRQAGKGKSKSTGDGDTDKEDSDDYGGKGKDRRIGVGQAPMTIQGISFPEREKDREKTRVEKSAWALTRPPQVAAVCATFCPALANVASECNLLIRIP